MNTNYYKEFEVKYYEINKYQEATPTTILNYLEETAISHSEAVGFGVDKLRNENLAWLLRYWILNMDQYPSWKEKVIIETWACNFKYFYATREFIIKNNKGDTLGKATSQWVFLNIKNKKPLRIPKEIINAYGIISLRAVEKSFDKLCYYPNGEIKQEFFVRRSDIDTNNHVNNTKYVEWILETVPQNTYDNFNLSFLEIQYKKETIYGSPIISCCNELNDGYVHCILDKTGNNELAVAKTFWGKR